MLWRLIFLPLPLWRTETLPPAGTRLLQELFISAGRGSRTRYSIQSSIFRRSHGFHRWIWAFFSIVSFRGPETVHHTGGGGVCSGRQEARGYTQQAGFCQETADAHSFRWDYGSSRYIQEIIWENDVTRSPSRLTIATSRVFFFFFLDIKIKNKDWLHSYVSSFCWNTE